MSFLLDTNVLSELRKGERADSNVAAWARGIPDDQLFLSVITIGEIRRGVVRLEPRDPQQAAVFQRWLILLCDEYADRILGIDSRIAEVWGEISAVRARPVADTLIAATALVHGMTVVTRNAADFAGTGVAVTDPFGFRDGGV